MSGSNRAIRGFHCNAELAIDQGSDGRHTGIAAAQQLVTPDDQRRLGVRFHARQLPRTRGVGAESRNSNKAVLPWLSLLWMKKPHYGRKPPGGAASVRYLHQSIKLIML